MKSIKRASLDNPELVLALKGSLSVKNDDEPIIIIYVYPMELLRIINAEFSDLFDSVAISFD